jgi:hypothetical protein
MLTLWCPQFILEDFECGAVRKTPGKLGKTKRSKVQNASLISPAYTINRGRGTAGVAVFRKLCPEPAFLSHTFSGTEWVDNKFEKMAVERGSEDISSSVISHPSRPGYSVARRRPRGPAS